MKLTIPYCVLALFATVFFSSCHDDNEVVKTIPKIHLLTIDATQRTEIAERDNWFFISDESGKLINFSHDSVASTIVFEGNIEDDSISLTWVQNFGTAEAPVLIVNTYGALPVQSTISLNPVASVVVPPVKGSFDITITEIPEGEQPKLSIGALFVDYTTTAFGAPFTREFALFADTVSAFVSGYTVSGGPVYKVVHGIGNLDNPEFTYDEMVPFANTISLPSSTVSAFCRGAKSNLTPFADYFNGVLNYPQGDYTRKLGYLPGYDRYYLTIQTQPDESTSVTYNKIGSINTSPTIPAVTTSKIDLSLQHADVRVSRPATVQQLFWYSNTAFGQNQWSIVAPYGHVVHLTELPLPMVTAYPDLQFNSFSFSFANIIESVIPLTYTSFLETVLQGGTAPESESYSYSFN